MALFLDLHCGPYRLLLDVAHVVEVADRAGTDSATGQRPWRERHLPVTDLCDLLGVTAGARRQQVVVRIDGEPGGILDVDGVEALVELRDTQLLPLPALSAGLEGICDGVARRGDDSRGFLLRLRPPAEWPSAAIPETTP